MRKLVIVLTIICLLFAALAANAVPLLRSESFFGGVFSSEETPLVIERQELILDLAVGPPAPASCMARYRIKNPTEDALRQQLYFLSSRSENLVVTMDGGEVEVAESEMEVQLLRSLQDQGALGRADIRQVDVFTIEIESGVTSDLVLRFELTAGWDTRAAEFGPTAPQAAHLLNRLKEFYPPGWYVFNLGAARTFGAFGELDFTVILPRETVLLSNVELNAGDAGAGDVQRYREVFSGIPVNELDLKMVHPQKFNSIGATVGAGMEIPFDGRPVNFLAKAIFDVMISNHMLSLGIESNPFLGSLKGLLQYTLYPFGRTGWSPALNNDLHGGAALLYSFRPEQALGARIFAGIRIMSIFTFEIGYDHYFTDSDSDLRNGLVLMWPFSI